uniref:Uncharacterized protein n=1 Tax=Lygus hesperus TaxID=30085 RepID=A0A0A9YEI2_LYGHE
MCMARGANHNQLACIRSATLALDLKPALELALFARAVAFTQDGVWQSRRHFEGDFVALHKYFPKSKYLLELLTLKLPDPASTGRFGDIYRMDLDFTKPEVRDALGHQKRIFEHLTKLFSSNLHLADQFPRT